MAVPPAQFIDLIHLVKMKFLLLPLDRYHTIFGVVTIDPIRRCLFRENPIVVLSIIYASAQQYHFSESAQRFQFSHSFFPEEGGFCKRYYTGTVFGEMSCSQNNWNKIRSKVKFSLPVRSNFCEWIDS